MPSGKVITRAVLVVGAVIVTVPLGCIFMSLIHISYGVSDIAALTFTTVSTTPNVYAWVT